MIVEVSVSVSVSMSWPIGKRIKLVISDAQRASIDDAQRAVQTARASRS